MKDNLNSYMVLDRYYNGMDIWSMAPNAVYWRLTARVYFDSLFQQDELNLTIL